MESQEKIEYLTTITHIAKPCDSRCSWWQGKFDDEISVKHLEERAPITLFRKGSDLELTPGDILIDSEANHPRKARGYLVSIGFVTKEKVEWTQPNLKMKMHIKAQGHRDLMIGSGDVIACTRIALWLKRQPDIFAAWEEISDL